MSKMKEQHLAKGKSFGIVTKEMVLFRKWLMNCTIIAEKLGIPLHFTR